MEDGWILNYLGVLLYNLQDWICFIYKGDSAEIFIE